MQKLSMGTSLQCLRARTVQTASFLNYSEWAAECINDSKWWTFQKNADENDTGCHFPLDYGNVFQLNTNVCIIYQVLFYVSNTGQCESQRGDTGSCILTESSLNEFLTVANVADCMNGRSLCWWGESFFQVNAWNTLFRQHFKIIN